MQMVGPYALQERLGEGASSRVYRALAPGSTTPVAVKIFKPHLLQDELGFERFQRELQVIQRLDHPSIGRIFEFHQGEHLALVTEHLDAVSLNDWMKLKETVTVDEFLGIFSQLLGVFEFCHARGLVHRNIKPNHIFVRADGRIKVIDFGVSQLTSLTDLVQGGISLGAPEYLAPELFATSLCDGRSDIYALGVVAYEMLTGQLPVQAENFLQIFAQKMRHQVTPLLERRADVPEWLAKIVMKMLERDLTSRYSSVADVRLDVRARSFHESPPLAVREVTCFKCGDLTPGAFSVCLTCGFDPKVNITDSKTVALWVMPNSESAGLPQLMKELGHPQKKFSVGSQGRKLFGKIPVEWASLLKAHAKRHALELKDRSPGVTTWIRAHPLLIFTGFLVHLIAIHWAQIHWPQISNLNLSLKNLSESELALLLPIPIATLIWYGNLARSLRRAVFKEWSIGQTKTSAAVSEFAQALEHHRCLVHSQHRRWGKKFLGFYILLWNRIAKANVTEAPQITPIMNANFELLAIFDQTLVALNETRTWVRHQAASTGQTELSELEALHFQLSHHLIAMDSQLQRALSELNSAAEIRTDQVLAKLHEATAAIQQLLTTSRDRKAGAAA